MVERQFAFSIKPLKTDGGLEFKLIVALLKREGIMHICKCPYMSEKNIVVKSTHIKIVEKGLA